MNNTITSEQFLKLKKQQQVELWEQGKLSTAQLVDWILGYGDDEDVEWLCANFDPEETITKY
jgi:hypothetical protein